MKKMTWILFWFFFHILFYGCEKDMDEIIEENLSVLNLEFEGSIPTDDKIDMSLFETVDGVQSIYDGTIERRGGFSISFPKHSYEIDIVEDVSIAGLPADDDWILNANYIDKTFLRHVVSYDLFTAMDDDNITSESQYVEVELNGEYNGLYVLMEKLDKSSLELNSSDSLAFIFKDPHVFRESYVGVIPQDINNFHQQTYPKIEVQDKVDFIEGLRDFILNSPDSEFEDMFSTIFNIENIIDWHLLLLITNNSDGILKNFYLYKTDKDTPVKVAPWDYDHSFGRDGDNELNLDERHLNIERSILFRRLLQNEWYKVGLKGRWKDLNNKSILSTSGLRSEIVQRSKAIRGAVNKNFEVWPIDSVEYYDANNFDEEIDIILNFIQLRHERLTKYFDEF